MIKPVGARAFALPAADEAKAQRVQRSAGDEGGLSPRTSAGHRKRTDLVSARCTMLRIRMQRAQKRNVVPPGAHKVLPYDIKSNCTINWNLSNCSTNRNYQIRIYLSVSINTALHGEPSAPSKFSGAAFKKYIPSDTSAKRIPSSKTTSADNSARWTAIGALCGPIV